MNGRRWFVPALLAAVLILGVPAAPAAAREGAPVSVPADGSALPAAPAQVQLTFDRRPDTGESHLVVLDDDNREVSPYRDPTGVGNSLIQGVRIDRAGNFTVVYHVVFTDGADEQGSLRFSVGLGVPPPKLATAAGHGHGIDPASAVLLALDGAVVLGVVLLLLARRPRARPVAWRLPPDRKDL